MKEHRVKEKHLVLVGAGHAHLTTIANLESIIALGARVTVISLGSYQYYSGMGPGLLSGVYAPGEVRFNVRAMSERHGATFMEGYVDGIDPDGKTLRLIDGTIIDYDVASFSVGSVIDTQAIGLPESSAILPVKPVERLFETRCAIQREIRKRDIDLVIIGGGAAGIEMAANAVSLGSSAFGSLRVTLITRSEILRNFPPRVKQYTRRKLARLGVRLIENTKVQACSGSEIALESGESVRFDRALVATGTRPPEIFKNSKLPIGRTEGLLVGPFLTSPKYPEVFGGGDCIDFEPRRLAKVGVYAVRQNGILLQNLAATIAEKPSAMSKFLPQHQYHLVLNFGDGTGLSYRKPLMLTGKKAFRLKDAIDVKFMRRFQECDEPKEKVQCPEV